MKVRNKDRENISRCGNREENLLETEKGSKRWMKEGKEMEGEKERNGRKLEEVSCVRGFPIDTSLSGGVTLSLQ